MLRVFCVLLLASTAASASAAPPRAEVITVKPARNAVDRFADQLAAKRKAQREQLARLKAKADSTHIARAERALFLRALTMPVSNDQAVATK